MTNDTTDESSLTCLLILTEMAASKLENNDNLMKLLTLAQLDASKLEYEDDKLRALVKDMWPFIKDPCPDRECCLFEKCDADSERECHIEEHMAARMRELGIEVD